jgi:serine/threonine-protein kinase
MTAGRALPIIAQAAEALAVAHDAGVVHRDIKPANIMVDGDGRVKVADFGIAQMATATRMTQSGMLVGTPEFISPEQCRGEKLDGRSDIYSLGVTLYQLLAGRTPFNADTPAALVFQIVEGPIPPVGELNPTVPTEVREIVAKMMHTDRNQRYQSAEDLIHALEAADTQPVTSGTRQHPAPGVVAADAHSDPTVAMPPGNDDGDEPVATEPIPSADAGADETLPATVAEEAPKPATPAAEKQEDPAPRQSPATEAYASDGSNRGALLGLAAVVLIIVTVLIVGWQFIGASGADEPFDPTADARPQGVPEQQSKEADNEAVAPSTAAEAGSVNANSEGSEGDAGDSEADAEADSPLAGSDAPPDGGSEGAVAAGAGLRANDPTRTSQASTDPPTAETPVSAAAMMPGGQGAADPQGAAERPPAAVLPPADSIVAETTGEYEYVEQVHAWIESAFGRQDFEVIDFASSPYTTLEEAARFQIVTSARLVGTEQLQYFGNVRTQYTVSLTSRVVELGTGRTAVGPEIETIKYTSLNMEQRLEQGVTALARRMARELRQAIRTP